MVQLKSSFLAIISFATLALATTVANVESDIATISSQVAALDTAITDFPATGGSIVSALAIHIDATNLATAINKATTDINGVSLKPVSESDGKTILAAVTGFEPRIIHALQEIAAKKVVFHALPIGGIVALVEQDLRTLSSSTSAFENALISLAPADLVSKAIADKMTIDAAFSSAIAAYN